jgi:hypothetical protein
MSTFGTKIFDIRGIILQQPDQLQKNGMVHSVRSNDDCRTTYPEIDFSQIFMLN